MIVSVPVLFLVLPRGSLERERERPKKPTGPAIFSLFASPILFSLSAEGSSVGFCNRRRRRSGPRIPFALGVRVFYRNWRGGDWGNVDRELRQFGEPVSPDLEVLRARNRKAANPRWRSIPPRWRPTPITIRPSRATATARRRSRRRRRR